MATWEEIQNGIFAGESGGDYDALFGYANRKGGQWSNVRVSTMTLGQVKEFSAVSGAYGQGVKGQIGRVATPMGAYQIVGTTLRAAQKELGLSDDTVFDQATQDKMGQWILAKQGTGAWEGYKGPRSEYVRHQQPEARWQAGDYAGSRSAFDMAPEYQAPPYEPMKPSSYSPETFHSDFAPMLPATSGTSANVGAFTGPGMSRSLTHMEAFHAEFTNSAIWKAGTYYLRSPSEGGDPWTNNFEDHYGLRALNDGYEGDNLFYMMKADNDADYDWRKRQTEIFKTRRARLENYEGWGHIAGAFLSPDALATMFLPMGVARNAVRVGQGALQTGAKAAAIAAPVETGLEVVRANYDPIENSVNDQFSRTAFAVAGAAALALPFGAFRAHKNLGQLRAAVGEQYLRSTGEVIRPEVMIGGKVLPIEMTWKRRELGGQMKFVKGQDVEVRNGRVLVTREFVERSTRNFHTNRAPGVETVTEQVAYDIAHALEVYRKGGSLRKGSADEAAVGAASERIGKAAAKIFGRKGKGGGVAGPHQDFSDAHKAGIEAVDSVRESMNRLHKKAWVEHLSRIQDSAYKRTHRNSLAGRTRDLMEVLVGDGGFAKAAHALGHTPGPSIASRVKVYDGIVAKLSDREKDLHAQYLGIKDNKTFVGIGKSDFSPTGDKLTAAQFRDEVSKTVITGIEHPIKQVNELAQQVLKEYNLFKEVGDKYGVFTSKQLGETRRQHIQNNMDAIQDRLMREADDLNAEEAGELQAQLDELTNDMKMAREEPSEDYFTRIWNPAAIRENREAFTEMVANWMSRQPYVQEWKPSKADWQKSLDELGDDATPAQREKIERELAAADDRSKWVWVRASTEPAGIRARAEKAVARILEEGQDEAINMMRDPARPVFARSRPLDIPNKMLLKDGPDGNNAADFIETNYQLVMQTYFERMAPVVELSRTFAKPGQGVDWQQGFRMAVEESRALEYEKWQRMANIDTDAAVENIAARTGVTKRGASVEPTVEMLDEARAILDEMGLKDVNLKAFDPERYPEMAGQVGYFMRGVDGEPNTIFMRGDVEDVFGTLRHEAVHALKAANAFDKNEWAELVGEGMRYRKLFRLDGRWKGLNKSQMEEEAVAELFRYWSRMQGHPDALSALRRKAGLEPAVGRMGLIHRLFNKIVDIFTATSRAQKFNDTKVDKILGRVYGRDRAVDTRVGSFDDHWAPINRDFDEMLRRVSNRIYKNADRWDNRTASALKSWGSMTYMGMSAFPALQEIGVIAARHGFGRMVGSILYDVDDMMANVAAKAGAEEILYAGASLDIQKGAGLASFAETGVDPANISRSERLLRTAGSKFQLWNVLAPVTRRLKEMDGALRVPDMLARIDRVARGAEVGDDIEYLTRYGISRKAAQGMAEQPMVKTENGWIANTEDWTNEELRTRFRAAIRQGNENTVLMATHADRPTFVDGVFYFRKSPLSDGFAKKLGMEDQGDYWRMQSGMLSLPFMFWNYGIAATNKIMISGIDEPSMRLMSGLSAMVGMTFIVESLRSNAWPHLDMSEKMAHVIEKSGIVGSIPEYMKTASDGLLLTTGDTPFNEWDQSRWSAFQGLAGAGPTAATNLVGGAATMDPDMFRSGVAGQNHFLFRDLLDATVSGIERNGG